MTSGTLPSRTIHPGMTRIAATKLMRRIFAEAGIDSPDLDARRLLEAFAGVTSAALLTAPNEPLGPGAMALAASIDRRLAREPVSRIIGERAFRTHTFRISEATLDPRPETETLVDAVLATAACATGAWSPQRILDIGTGSGCILISLLAALPAARGIGTDILPEALEVAAGNAMQIGVADRLQWETVPARHAEAIYRTIGKVDLIVSNPPYIPSADIAALEADVRMYDPRAALDGGPDGLDVYREIINVAPLVLDDGWLFLEIGVGQHADVSRLLDGMPGRTGEVQCWRDFAGLVRCVAARIRRQP